MTEQELIDDIHEALSNAQDMDTTLMDLARAVVRDVSILEGQLSVALDRINQAVRDRGYPVDLDIDRATAFFGSRKWLLTSSRINGQSLGSFGDTLTEAVAGMLAKVADLPHRWTPEQVAATLGIEKAA